MGSIKYHTQNVDKNNTTFLTIMLQTRYKMSKSNKDKRDVN